MTEYISRVGQGHYKIIFDTDDEHYYHMIEDIIRLMIDSANLWQKIAEEQKEKSADFDMVKAVTAGDIKALRELMERGEK